MHRRTSRTAYDADATSSSAFQRADDEWSLASFDVQSIASEDVLPAFDVRSLASDAEDDVISVASSHRSRGSVTATFGDHLLDGDTAGTGPIPLAALPQGVLLPRHMTRLDDQQSESGASLVSVNTRRGWPQVARFAPQHPVVPARGTYLDALLRDPSEQPPPPVPREQRTAVTPHAGWTTLSRRSRGARVRARLRGPEIPLCPLEEEPDERQSDVVSAAWAQQSSSATAESSDQTGAHAHARPEPYVPVDDDFEVVHVDVP